MSLGGYLLWMMRARVLVAVLAVIGAGCNLPGGNDPIPGESTTTTNTIAITSSTTEVTLPPAEESERGEVTEVIDGDSFVAAIAGAVTEVRMVGVNAPEADECFGSEARSLLTRMIEGSQVVLTGAVEDVDPFGRSLRQVYLESGDGTIHVNAQIVAEGMAVATSGPDPTVQGLKSVEAEAYASGRGMWGTFACGQPEGGFPDRPQIRVAAVSADPEGPDEDDLDGEWVEIVNEGYAPVSVAGWIVRDESSSNRLILPAGTSLAVGQGIRIVSACGSSGAEVVYWCAEGPVWNNEGDTVYLLDNMGNAVERYVVVGPGS
jgi:micrococcal nuclease